ncbi:MAG: pilus assembly protein CpaB [Acidimicrobiales bacterium]|jgi:pilus assembly protein CpaB
MRQSVIGVVLALILAAIGTVALVTYVSRAEERAREGEELVEVYVVEQLIPTGTPSEQIEPALRIEEVPLKVRPNNSVDNLANLAGQVTAVDLVPGEQLLGSRFVTRANFTNREAGVDVPDDKIEITISLDPERAVGGLLLPGDLVAVFASFEPFDLQANVVEVDGEEVALPASLAADTTAKTPNSTDLLLHQVLVTAVQEEISTNFDEDEERDRLKEAPEDRLLITLAVNPADAERIIFTAEFGLVWLGAERETVPDTDDPIQTRLSVYDKIDGPL